MRYVVVIGNFLFHIKLYYCNRLNLYFTSNFVNVMEVSNWVAGKFDKLALFFSLISSLSPMSILFFFFISIFLSHHTSSFFFSSQFPTFSHHIYLPNKCLSLFFSILVSLFISPTSISYFFSFLFFILISLFLSPTFMSMFLSLSLSLSFLFFLISLSLFLLSVSQNSNLSTNYKTYLSNFHFTLIFTNSKFSL